MRAKIILLHFARLLLLLLLVFVIAATFTADPIAFDLQKEMGSRSMLRNASVRERDFRFDASIDEVLNVGSANLFTPDDSSRKEKAKTGRKMNKLNGNLLSDRSSRTKRSEDAWITSDIDEADDFLKMHALIVRDEYVPECGTPADKFAKHRHFLCSGVILNENRVLTSATCVYQAHIREYNIEADLAVLIGALDKNSYIIKIVHYDIHPYYVPDPDSIRHATNNIALLRLSCSIPRKYVVVPKLPSKRFEDVAHLCCTDRCKLSTVISNSKNQHFIRFMKLKHLPSPQHVDIKNSDVSDKKKNATRSNFTWNDKVQRENTKKELQLQSLRGRNVRQVIHDTVKTANPKGSLKSHNTAGTKTSIDDDEKSANDFVQDDDQVINWRQVKKEMDAENVTEQTEKILLNFVENSISDVMTKLLEVVTHHIADTSNIFSYFGNILQEDVLLGEDSYHQISDLIGKRIMKFTLEEMSVIPHSEVINCTQNCNKCTSSDNFEDKSEAGTVAQNELDANATVEAMKDDKSEKSNKGGNEIGQESDKFDELSDEDKSTAFSNNVFCPPLGSPVIANSTLVALIAYTCDDVQNWVEWKYVNIVRNVRWIYKQLRRNRTSVSEDFRSLKL